MSFEGLFSGVRLLESLEAMRSHSIEAFEKQDYFDSFGREPHIKSEDAIKVLKSKRLLYVLGKPGAGKTTFLKH